ncbi:uncharacterized protein I303_100240 [Kwoniella dejecticola CBS 10117]|uniref:UBA domain-containing protein n=1 Tax=Kwoniella dejecticola CBS 10117 TaxID=1296121 RepID=A0AAJ8MBX4_9TREE
MDDLVDLNWSAPSTTAPPAAPQKSKSPTGSSGNSFDFLSLSKPQPSGGNTPNYYSSTPLRSSTPPQAQQPPLSLASQQFQPTTSRPNGSKPISRSNTPLQNGPSAAASTTSGIGGLDAFSSLLSMPSSSSGASKNMTMADRQKAMEEEKKRQADEDRKRFEAEGHFWENLGSSSTNNGANIIASSSTNRPASTPQNDFDDFLKPSPTVQPRAKSPVTVQPPPSRILSPNSATTSRPSSAAGTFWDTHQANDDLLSPSGSIPPQAQSNAPSPTPPVDPFDFDALSASVPTRPVPQSQSNGGTGGHGMDDDEYDILGDLAKPVTARPSNPEPGPSRAPRHAQPARSSSPPPHIVGQIVEMGFSPVQARQALAATETGLDVQAALEILLGSANTNTAGRSQGQDEFGEDDEDFVERERQRMEEEDRERRRRRRQGPSRNSVKARSAEEQERDREIEFSTQEQAEKYLAQASELGTNMFNKATSFWNSSKEKAMKVYEEQRKAMEASAAASASGEGRKPVKDGRPRWMTEGDNEFNADSVPENGGFRDDDDAQEETPRIRQNRPSNGDRQTHKPTSSRHEVAPSSSSSAYKSSKERADLLFAEDSPRYVSPARHPKKPATSSIPISRSPAPPPVKPLPIRPLVSATSSQLEKSATYKLNGNEHFKLGRFSEAESSYTTAMTQLPENHLFLIPLHNNRAAARLKLGDSSPAVEDCTLVIDLIGPTYHPSKEAPLPPEVSKEVKLYEGLVKALSKRAQAWEMAEKWKNAVEDWEKLLGMDLAPLGVTGNGTKNLAAEGARRARKALEGDQVEQIAAPKSAVPSNAHVKLKAAPVLAKTAKPADVDRSAAVSELRAQAKALELEDEQRLALKDGVEARLNSWKNGKETNLRALIASLDSILWDDILKGGLKVGIHELISEKQVKIKYMKVIARLHPDKLNSQNTTVEQRMLANGAFGTLNEAWQAFNK